MNNFYTLQSLVELLRYTIPGKEIKEVWSHRKDQIDVYLYPENTGKLTFSAASPGTALFWDPRGEVPSRNAASFFHEIQGMEIADMQMLSEHDRLFQITFLSSDYKLLFKPFSSRPNLFLVNDGIITAAFKNPSENKGKQAPVPQPPPSSKQHPADSPSGNSASIKKRILTIDPQFPRGLIKDVNDTCQLDEQNDDELKLTIGELQQYLNNPDNIHISAEGQVSLLPAKYLSHPPERSFESVNDAVRTLFLTENRRYRLLPRKNELVKKLQKKGRSLDKQLKQIDKNEERQEKADNYEHLGHLLMSQPDPNSPVTGNEVIINDWAQQGEEVRIPVNQGESLLQKAKSYYDKAAGIRREIAISGQKREQLASQQTDIAKKLEEVNAIEHPPELDQWIKKHAGDLQKAGLAPTGKKQQTRPFREMGVNNYSIWIGKSAKSNDEVLAHAHKEDIWMHVRGSAGSHVILRNNGQIEWPDHTVLMKVASFAAAFSKQAGASLVPVMMAKRKHVRKPKGAGPGQVTVTHEKVEMVPPRKPDLSDS